MTYLIKPAKRPLKTVKAKPRTVQPDNDMQVMKKYSVLLSRPSDDTYLAHILAIHPEAAVVVAQLEATEADDRHDPTNYEPRLVAEGWITDVTPAKYR